MSHLGSYVLYLIKCNFFLFHIANLAIIPDLTNIRFLGRGCPGVFSIQCR